MKSTNSYGKPLEEKYILGRPESPLHKGRLKYAEDYLCKRGTPTKAMADGIVIKVVDGKYEKSDEERLKDEDDPGNNILIQHANGEYTHYAHLQKGSIIVKKGDRVKEDQEIALTGHTGYSIEPHLHVSVIECQDKNKPLSLSNFRSLKINHENNSGKSGKLESLVFGTIALIGIVGGLSFLSPNITGNVLGGIAQNTSNWVGGILFIFGLVGSFYYFKKKY